MPLQYCEIGKHWLPDTEFYNEKKGFHGNRRWCKRHAADYAKKHNAAKKRLLRKLIRFWNKHHKNRIPLP